MVSNLGACTISALLVIGCSGRQTNEAPNTGSPSTGTACAPLASFAGECPADWTAANVDKTTFCAQRPMPEASASVSTDACRGWLRYTKHLFDAGPRYCIYDPKTQELAGYRAYDGKAGYEAWSCGVDKAVFDDDGCTSTSC